MTDETINIMGPEMLTDPFGVYARVREENSVARGTMPGVTDFWLVTRYDDVTAVMADPRFVGDVKNIPGIDAPDIMEQMLLATGVPADYLKYLRPSISELDGPEHGWYRRVLSRVLTVRRVRELRPRMVEISDRLIGELPEKAEDGVVDLLKDYAVVYSITVICELIGIPELGRVLWEKWSQVLAAGAGAGREDAIGATLRNLVQHLHELVDQRRAQPREDLVSALLEVRQEDADLDDTTIIRMVLGLILAGHENTANVITNSMAALLAHPSQFALMRTDPDLVEGAFDECMRWAAPVLGSRLRYATENLEVAGMPVAKGEAVVPVLAAANRDPRKFENPEKFDIRRRPDRECTHLAFGYGIHYCSGAALAREEALVALSGLAAAFPDLSLTVEYADLQRGPNPGAYYLSSLPVKL